MTKRIVSLISDNYEFKKNFEYENQWEFLECETRKIIASQLTFLEFHEWLQQNVTSANTQYPGSKQPLAFDIEEGFFKSDILLFGAICETALFEMTKNEYKKECNHNNKEVNKCFQVERIKKYHFSDQKFEIKPISETPGHIGFFWYETKEKNNRDIQFIDLISAGKSLGIYNDSLQEKLESLRNDRNTIHLTLQAQRKYKENRNFTNKDREQAKKTTEELRKALYIHYIVANDLF